MSDILMCLGHFGMSLTLVYIHRSGKLLVEKKITYREDATRCDTFITKPLTLKENKKFECYLVAVTQGHLQPRCLSRKREKHNEKWKQFHKKRRRNPLKMLVCKQVLLEDASEGLQNKKRGNLPLDPLAIDLLWDSEFGNDMWGSTSRAYWKIMAPNSPFER